jgi:hypothetical protein
LSKYLQHLAGAQAQMSPVPANPFWQNFSSMFREVITAQEVGTGMEKSHHLTASLYFGIAALEAFLNQKMRTHLTPTKTEKEILKRLREGDIKDKMKEWPKELLGKSLTIDRGTWNLIVSFNDLRGHLTHPKTQGQDIYDKLEKIKPTAVIDSVAEYIVRFHEAEGMRFPYWIFGWNYLNPRSNSYDFLPMNEQQFCFSLQALGFDVPVTDQWIDEYLGTFAGYKTVKQALDSSKRCEPKSGPFPFKPILCRRWWTSEHHQSCGRVTDAALDRARSSGRRPRRS